MKRISNSAKAKMKMETAIWKHGRKKAIFTTAIQKLKETGLGDNKDVKKVIDLLITERMKLDKIELF